MSLDGGEPVFDSAHARARPSLAEIGQVRAERSAVLRSYLDTLTDEEFLRERPSTTGLPWPRSEFR